MMHGDELRNERKTLSNQIGSLMKEGKKEEAEAIKVTLDLDDDLSFDVYGISEAQFEEYINLCKERGYTKDADKDEYSYDAERDDEYSVSVDYHQTDCIMDVSVSK